MSSQFVIAAIHGIMTRQTVPGWPDYFDVWMWTRDPRVRVIKKEYLAGPFPAWNVWVTNWYLAHSLAAELEVFGKEGAHIGILAHSNGCDVALKTLRLLARRRVDVDCMVLAGGACEEDVRKNGIERLIAREKLGRAIAYSSPHDRITKPFFIWPYGHLGHAGFTRHGKPVTSARVFTRWFPEYGHGDYFSDRRFPKHPYYKPAVTFRERTFEQAYQDLTAKENFA